MTFTKNSIILNSQSMFKYGDMLFSKKVKQVKVIKGHVILVLR